MLERKHRRSSALKKARNPERTRQRLLQAAFQEVYKSGFQSADLDAILGKAGVTKGALYHHFENKEALGYAVVEEVIAAMTREKWLRPLQNATNPIDALIGVFATDWQTEGYPLNGCPLNNLAQEMSALNEGFRKKLAKVFTDWQAWIAAALREGQKAKLVRSDIDPQETGTFVVALYEGYVSLAKNSQDPKLLEHGDKSLIRYLETLRETRARR
jgi:TetR/AcrR family transcriptional repressor of nem operon